MNGERILRHAWLRKYLLTVAVVWGIMAVALVLGWTVLGSFIWYPGDLLYESILRPIRNNIAWLFPFLMALTATLTACRQMGRIADSVNGVTEAVDRIYTGDDSDISLGKDLRYMELPLKSIQYDIRLNKQAAEEATARKNDMIMYMAHDLKTPLTSVIGYLSLLDAEPDLPEDSRKKFIGIALRKSQRLEELINEFFDITRFNFTHMILEKERVDFSVMVRQMMVEFEPVFSGKDLKVTGDIEPGVMAFLDVDKMERVLDNLLRNIVNYSYNGSDVTVQLRQDPGVLRLVTVNRGRTIPKEMLDHLFEQFFRMDTSRGSEEGGSGLGLAVTKEIVSLHGGTIRCDSADETITFTVEIPLGFVGNPS